MTPITEALTYAAPLLIALAYLWGIIYLTPDNSSGSYLLVKAIDA